MQPHGSKYGTSFGNLTALKSGFFAAAASYGRAWPDPVGCAPSAHATSSTDTFDVPFFCHQLMRWSTSKSGAAWAASSQFGATSTPSSICTSHPSHNGGPRAGVMRCGSVSTPMCSSIWRMSALTRVKC